LVSSNAHVLKLLSVVIVVFRVDTGIAIGVYQKEKSVSRAIIHVLGLVTILGGFYIIKITGFDGFGGMQGGLQNSKRLPNY